jgi:hypothetical protein
MKTTRRLVLFLLSFASALTAAVPAWAQQLTGTLGSPSATTSISGHPLPPPDPKFGGVIKNEERKESACATRD